MAGAFMDRRRMHMCTRERALPGRPGVGGRVFYEQLVLIDVLLIAGVGNRGEQRLRDEARRFLGRELENRERLIDLLADDQFAHKMKLARRDSDEAGSRYGFHDYYNFPLTPWPRPEQPVRPAMRIVSLRLCDRRRGRERSGSAKILQACGQPCSQCNTPG